MLNLTPKLFSEGKALGAITETLYGYDHFDGKVLDSAAEGCWNPIGTDGTDDPTLLADERGGVLQIDADSASPAVGGLAYERNWAPEQQGGRMIHEVKFKINTDLITRYVFVGWNDNSAPTEDGALELPIILAASAAYGLVVAGDHAGVVFHTVGHATNAYLVATLNGVNVGTPVLIPGLTMTADRWIIFRCEIDALGNVYGFGGLDTDADGVKTDKDFAEVRLELGVTPTDNLCPYFVMGQTDAANAAFIEVDYSYFGGNVDATAA